MLVRVYRRTAVILPLLVAATILPVLTPKATPRVRHWTMTATDAVKRAPGDFSLVGLSVPRGRAPAGVALRVSRDGKRWGRWERLEFEREVGPDIGSRETGASTSMPVWTGPNRYVQVRGAPSGSEVHTVDPGPDPSQPASSALAYPSKPKIVTRAQWGADESIRRAKPSYAGALHFAVVHHTATSDSYSKSESDNIVRGIYAYHVKTNGWDDIGYNFLVDRYGQVFEGRYGGVDRNVIGAHSQGFNTGSTGVAVIGNFASSKPPSIAMGAIKRILSWRMDQGMIDPTSSVTYTSNGSNKYPEGKKVKLKRVIGHRDVGQTSCPGNPLQGALSWIRSAAYKDGLPKLFDAKVSRAAITPNGDGVADALKLTGRFSAKLKWTVRLVDAAGASKRSWTGSGSTLNVNVYGKDSSNALLPHGAYRLKVGGKDPGLARSYYLPFSIYKWANGTFMYTTSKITYVLTKGVLRHPSSWQSRATHYLGHEWVGVPDSITKYYPKSSWLGFREGSLVGADGEVYLISEGKKRPTSRAVLAAKGFDTDAIIATNATALRPHATGETFGSGSPIPNGSALRSSTGTEGWMLDGVGRRFLNTKVRRSHMIRDIDFTQPADELLASGLSSPPLGFRDGTVVRVDGQPGIYLISDGKRRGFPSAAAFKAMGYRAENITPVTAAELSLHPQGASL